MRVDKNDVPERSITTSRQAMTPGEVAEEIVKRKKIEDCFCRN